MGIEVPVMKGGVSIWVSLVTLGQSNVYQRSKGNLSAQRVVEDTFEISEFGTRKSSVLLP